MHSAAPVTQTSLRAAHSLFEQKNHGNFFCYEIRCEIRCLFAHEILLLRVLSVTIQIHFVLQFVNRRAVTRYSLLCLSFLVVCPHTYNTHI